LKVDFKNKVSQSFQWKKDLLVEMKEVKGVRERKKEENPN
jgi:hypothetical protein